MNSKQVTLGLATLGAGALLGLGAFGVMSSGTSAAQDEEPSPGPATSVITTSETTITLPAVSATQPQFPS